MDQILNFDANATQHVRVSLSCCAPYNITDSRIKSLLKAEISFDRAWNEYSLHEKPDADTRRCPVHGDRRWVYDVSNGFAYWACVMATPWKLVWNHVYVKALARIVVLSMVGHVCCLLDCWCHVVLHVCRRMQPSLCLRIYFET